MRVTERHADGGIRWWGVLLISVAGAAALIAALGALVSLIVARTVVTPPRRRSTDIRVLAFDEKSDSVTVTSTPDSRLPGKYSYFFDGDRGSARIGEILSSDSETVTRRVIDVTSGRLAVGARGRFSGWYFLDPSEFGLPFEEVELATDLGPAPAWLIHAASDAGLWVINVHGRAVKREETLRAVPVFHDAGYTSLLISYRNDGDAPASADRRYALGDTEWRDVDVAVEYAITHGAKSLVLMGWSMGGATVLQELTRSRHAGVIRGVVLDSPVIDWATALRFQGDLRRLPEPVSEGALSLIGTNWGRRLTGQGVAIDLPRLDFVARAGELHVPILLMHSDDDGFVPITASRALAAERPDIVTFEAFSVAAHAKLWNFDPVRWTSAISQWLAELAASGHN